MSDNSAKAAAFRERVRRDRIQKEKSYRAQALKLLPHICASCGREFAGRRLSELTVHHKDHDHTNNPTDGSNWELLCLYCHDNEHEKFRMKGFGTLNTSSKESSPSLFNPFESLTEVFSGQQKPPADNHADDEKQDQNPEDSR